MTPPKLSTFDDLLAAARQHTQPQRLLLVFVEVELPDDATDSQRVAFEKGMGGTLEPIMAVDKDAQDLASMRELAQESHRLNDRWHLFFAGALQSERTQPLTNEQVDQALDRMIDGIRSGQFHHLAAFDREGNSISWN